MLQLWLENVSTGVPWPQHLQAIVDRCREDLALVVASTDADTAKLLEGVDVGSFEALRGLLQNH